MSSSSVESEEMLPLFKLHSKCLSVHKSAVDVLSSKRMVSVSVVTLTQWWCHMDLSTKLVWYLQRNLESTKVKRSLNFHPLCNPTTQAYSVLLDRPSTLPTTQVPHPECTVCFLPWTCPHTAGPQGWTCPHQTLQSAVPYTISCSADSAVWSVLSAAPALGGCVAPP